MQVEKLKLYNNIYKNNLNNMASMMLIYFWLKFTEMPFFTKNAQLYVYKYLKSEFTIQKPKSLCRVLMYLVHEGAVHICNKILRNDIIIRGASLLLQNSPHFYSGTHKKTSRNHINE